MEIHLDKLMGFITHVLPFLWYMLIVLLPFGGDRKYIVQAIGFLVFAFLACISAYNYGPVYLWSVAPLLLMAGLSLYIYFGVTSCPSGKSQQLSSS